MTQVHTEDVPTDNDEPPLPPFDKKDAWLPKLTSAYNRTMPTAVRRESLLTRQLHSETEHSDDELFVTRTASTWSIPSTTSTAELTSDDGRSVASPAISPPLAPTIQVTPIIDKPLNVEPKILGLEVVKDTVEAGLGRKRCITFACGNKETPTAVKVVPATPPKRKCALRFICPTKAAEVQSARKISPAPKHRRSSSSVRPAKSPASPASPRLSRKSPVLEKPSTPKRVVTKRYDYSDDSGAEATRFHEFASSEDEPDEWTQESTCFRNRLCVSDTLKKENVIRQLAEEVAEEEAVEEEDDEEDEEEDEMEDEVEDEVEDDDDADVKTIAEVNDADSDAGFHSDDEGGFAVSDSEDGSDNEWWTPAGVSTAATSAEHLDHLSKITPRSEMVYGSSLASDSSDNNTVHRPRPVRTHSKSSAVKIDRPATPDLPDSTDFVCGTLDEDRPKEQAYINCMKEREAAKHPLLPQDIDPTFPTSDPEMDEEDDDDVDDAVSSGEDMLHGSLDSIHGTARRVSPARRDSIKRRSPVPLTATRNRSPAPKPRARSPAPFTRNKSPAPKVRARSPAPLTRTRTKSPAPKVRARSPAPLTRTRTKSPVPTKMRPTQSPASPTARRLFGQSPRLLGSPPPSTSRMTSPPNTRRASPTTMPSPHRGLAGRPNTLAVTASLPKRPGGFLLSRLGVPSEDSDTAIEHHGGRRRGAIDIVKGLEKKKQRRHEKLCQKMAAKAAARGEERKKVKPGRGCERMREVGLELQKYKGGAGHILSY